MRRRQVLKGAGAVIVLVAAGGVWRAYDQGVFRAGSGLAYEPWTDWRSVPSEGGAALVRAGILASNPHNTQPWLFRATAHQIEVYADEARNLGSFDPYLREMHLGLGCAVENMALAAEANGYTPDVTLSEGTLGPIPDEPGSALVARIDLAAASARTSSLALYEAIGRRHTNRHAYEADRALPPEAIEALRKMAADDAEIDVDIVTTEPDKARCRAAIVQATEAIIEDEQMVHASDAWFRHSWSDIQDLRDGVTLDAAGLAPVMTSLAKMMPSPSPETNHSYWLDATRDTHVATAPAFGFITVRDLYDKAQTLRAGRVWQRMHLWATTQRLAMQPLNQPVEWIDRERQLGRASQMAHTLAEIVGDPKRKPTFAFRVGYAVRDADPSPRRPLEQVLI